MAAKSNTRKENDATESKSIGLSTGEKRVSVFLPRIPGADDDVFYSVNGIDYIIKRGFTVEVPESLAEVIRNGQNAENAAFEFQEKLLNDANSKDK